MIRIISPLFLLVLPAALSLADIEWPQEIEATEGTIVVYQPQPETLDGNILTGRAAVSLEMKNVKEAVFGAMWFRARLDTDLDERTAVVRDVTVERVRWPGSDEEGEMKFSAIVEEWVSGSEFEISLDRLAASLESSAQERKSLELLKNDPPVILFRDRLAVLLTFDGEPRFMVVEGTDYERAMNTPFAVVRTTTTGKCYLSSGSSWYMADDPKGPWSLTDSPPADLTAMIETPEGLATSAGDPPEIVVAVEPTELICTQGTPEWQSLPDGTLLYVRNTETPWLRDLSSGAMYVLLAGRWYTATGTEGPWVFVRPDRLPAAFKDIPPESDIGGVRTSVPGTEEAADAMLDATIPQTTTVNRSEASLTVHYDGAPSFEAIAGTDVSYAVNTGSQVLEIGGRYYAVDNGVWFTSAAPDGPWILADSIPESEISTIPPSAPVYNVTYVTVYQSTPAYVTYGYYPGYVWSFPYYGVPIYGTGWYYPPYYGRYYYPRPPTWGFHAGYNPWTGWNFGVSWSNGFFRVGVSWGGGYRGPYRPYRCCGGWYGGGYTRGPTVINTGTINIGNSVNVGNRTKAANRIGSDPGFAQRRDGSRNIYDRPENRSRNVVPSAGREKLNTARPAPSRQNNVYTDRQGNVARHSGGGWESRTGNSWTKQGSGSRPELNRAQSARQSGASRANRMGSARGGGRRR